jgi:hypothetical protein
MKTGAARYTIEELREGVWVEISHRTAYNYSNPIKAFESHERAKGEALGTLNHGDTIRRVLAPDGSVLGEVSVYPTGN